MAMGIGAVGVYPGLLGSFDDDEVAIVIGHELAHCTHEHTQKSFQPAFWASCSPPGSSRPRSRSTAQRPELLNLTAAFSMLAWITTFFFGSHSRSSHRFANLQSEIARNDGHVRGPAQ